MKVNPIRIYSCFILIYNQDLAYWVRNNWRPYSLVYETKVNVKVNLLQVVWKTQKDAAENELRDILGVQELLPSHPGYFQQRNAAAKHVMDKMNEQKKIEFQTKVKEMRAECHPESIQRE